MSVAGCLGTSNRLWALKVILITLENNFGNRKRLLENWYLVGGKLAQALVFPSHVFKDFISCENTCNIEQKSEKSGLGWYRAVLRELCPDQSQITPSPWASH